MNIPMVTLITTSKLHYLNFISLRCFFRKYEQCSFIEEGDITRLVRAYDRNVDSNWNFSEFISAVSPLCQYSIKAQE